MNEQLENNKNDRECTVHLGAHCVRSCSSLMPTLSRMWHGGGWSKHAYLTQQPRETFIKVHDRNKEEEQTNPAKWLGLGADRLASEEKGDNLEGDPSELLQRGEE